MLKLSQRVAALAGDLFGYKGRVVHEASPDGDYLVDNPNRRSTIIAKASDELGSRPGIALDEGLRRALLWYGANREAEEDRTSTRLNTSHSCASRVTSSA